MPVRYQKRIRAVGIDHFASIVFSAVFNKTLFIIVDYVVIMVGYFFHISIFSLQTFFLKEIIIKYKD